MQTNSRFRQNEEIDVTLVPSALPKKAIQIPVGFGMKLYLENRFMNMLFIGIVVNVFGALCNNEWLYLLSSSFISAAIIGALLPLLILKMVKFTYALPDDVLSSDQALVIVKLKKKKFFGWFSRFIPLKWIRLTISASRRGKDGTTFEPIFSPEPVLIESLEDERWFEFPTPHLHRGVYKFHGIELSTCFPLGITWWSRKIDVEEKENVLITVYPRHYGVSGNFLSHLRGVSSTMGLSSALSAVTHQSTSFRSVREFRTGDSLRHIHWRLTAKSSEILVKEFDQETLPVFNLLLNLRANWQNKEQFELAVSTAMSLCHLGYEMGQIPNLILNPRFNSKDLKPMMSDIPVEANPGLEKYSEILARVEPVSLRSSKAADDEDLYSDEDYVGIYDRDLLTLLPTTEKVMKYSPGVGDVVCSPIELAIVPVGWEYDEAVEEYSPVKKAAANLVNFDKLRPGKAKAQNVKKEMGPLSGEIIGRVEWVKDLEAL